MNVFIVGQSYASPIVYQQAAQVFKDELREYIPQAKVSGYAIGGSAADKSHAPIGSTRWWYDTETNSNGPALTEAIDKIRSENAVFDVVLWLQGEQDSVWSQSKAADKIELDKYYTATRQILWRLKQACNRQAPTSVKVLMIHIGRRIGPTDYAGVQAIREAQFDVIRSSPSIEPLPGIYDLPLIGEFDGTTNNHHTDELESVYAKRAAWATSRLLGNVNAPQMPVATPRVVNNSIEIDFNVETTKPIKPEAFALRISDDGVVTDLNYVWQGDTLVITPYFDMDGNATLLYPYGQGREYDLNSIVRDNLEQPLTPFRFEFTTTAQTNLNDVLQRFGSVQNAVVNLMKSASDS